MYDEILTRDSKQFLEELHRRFNPQRKKLLEQRKRQTLDFPEETRAVRDDPSWKVEEIPEELNCRWVEITGPTDRKMMINAMNSGANVFMADFEDSNAPTWDNMVQGQINVRDTVNGTISFEGGYRLNEKRATLFVRPRGLHMNEKHFLVDGEEISASLFDAGLYLFHNAKAKKPYLYLPKIESYQEARLWNDVFLFVQQALGLPTGTIKATVLIETLPAAFQMEEILFELREHSAGLNAGRWDYIFSVIKCNQDRDLHLPDRDQITMTVPFMRAYAKQLVKVCHKRGAQPIGGMAAFIPDRKDPEVTRIALERVREDKLREIQDGFVGTWVAHPDLVQPVMDVFKDSFGHPSFDDMEILKEELLDFHVPGGVATEEGLKKNLRVASIYLKTWLSGRGAVAIDHLMEDVATAEISRAQVWKWIQEGTFTKEQVRKFLPDDGEASKILETLIFSDPFIDFLTDPAGEYLCTAEKR